MEAIILCGGEGTRIRHVWPDRPKPLIPVGGFPILDTIITHWYLEGVTRFVLSLHYKADQIKEHIRNSKYHDVCDFAVEPEPLGPERAIRFAAMDLQESGPYLVVNGDTYAPYDLGSLEKQLSVSGVSEVEVIYKKVSSGVRLIHPGKEGRPLLVQADEPFIDMGTPEGLAMLEKKLAPRNQGQTLWQ